MEVLKKLWQPLGCSQNSISALGILSLLMICVLAFYIMSPMHAGHGDWGEAALTLAGGVIALGQGIPAVAAAGTAIAGGAAAATIIAPCLVVVGGAALIGYGVAATMESISEDREASRRRNTSPSQGRR